ncbi:MAG: dihydropteroate synthase [Nitrosomonas sp.]|nr:dihydropteroate synthase [Nitrosomonas sp.]
MHHIDFSKKPLIMGVVNVTPDSFSDGGEFLSVDSALQQARKLMDEGADIIDIGGESTRPGSQSVDAEEELRRISPLLDALVTEAIPISVDTSKPEVMQYAIKVGAAMINDVNALRAPGALEVVAASKTISVCLMHMQGKPEDMQNNPRYEDIVDDVHHFLKGRIQAAVAQGIAFERIVIDPGFGFGKTLQHNLSLLRRLDQFNRLGVPVLVGISRKSMLGMITGNPVDQRIHESVAAALIALINGATIVRVHDVKATKDALAVYTAIQEKEYRLAN